MTVITATQELGKEDYILRAYLGNLMKSCLNAKKKKCKKRARGCGSVVEPLSRIPQRGVGGVAQW